MVEGFKGLRANKGCKDLGIRDLGKKGLRFRVQSQASTGRFPTTPVLSRTLVVKRVDEGHVVRLRRFTCRVSLSLSLSW